ncbi:MAG: hypothetical protein UR68_C0003G0052 [Candidatus Roizmanbacteria bacterium GW2011_GWA2_35_19]|uniref:Photosystem I assembly BtpA n=2 Tax=Candidatus Roizmaniibacteriota TaxID=1752723 RepID=A0A0G0F2Z0_9BACT|nr:MAG: hypothetical protein UR63_C0008G0023 [Candidatus Roizmanbacteria bacterium GW2011_GWC2_35_12]KKP73757.1 MAG: hypothetical protein UR68_C0003G0052 [Candidatus Roizmanbacteria bacterium GW2011_GWA2_35_19]
MSGNLVVKNNLMFKQIFPKAFPIIGVIHLDPLPGEIGFSKMDSLLDQVKKSVEIFQKSEVDGILIENASDKPHTMTISKAQVSAMSVLVKQAVNQTKVPIGVTCLLLDWEANFAIAKATGAKFVRLNVFVDKVMRDPDTWKTINTNCRGLIDINPLAVKSYRKMLNAEKILLLADIHVKYMIMLEPKKTIDLSAKQAEFYGADAIIVSGNRTGLPTDVKDTVQAKNACNIPVLIGSGLVKRDIPNLLSKADGAIIGTAFEKEEGNIIFSQVNSFMKQVNKLRKNHEK